MKKHVLSGNSDTLHIDKLLLNSTARFIKIFCMVISYSLFFLPSASVILINFVVVFYIFRFRFLSRFVYILLLPSLILCLPSLLTLYSFSVVICYLFGFPLGRKSRLLSNFLLWWFCLLFHFLSCLSYSLHLSCTLLSSLGLPISDSYWCSWYCWLYSRWPYLFRRPYRCC